MPKKSSKKSSKSTRKKASNPLEHLYKSTPKNFRIGGDVLPQARDVGRFVRWPRYIRVQRQKKVLLQRLKTPPAVHQFDSEFALDKNQATQLFKLFNKYRPETSAQKKERLQALAAAEANQAGAGAGGAAPATLQYGLNHVTYLVEQKKAKLVAIASDVDPIELVLWLPALCRRMGVPFCIVKNRSRLGSLVHKKNATCVAITRVNPEDTQALDTLSGMCVSAFNENPVTSWGDRTLGLRTVARVTKREEARRREAAKRAAALA